MIKYIEVKTFISNNCIDIKEINAYVTLIEEYKVSIVFYGYRTVRSKQNFVESPCFIFTIGSVFYAFTYNSIYGLYKSIADYINAMEKNYLNAMTYYSIYEFNKEEADINKYLMKEYKLNEIILMQDYEVDNSENSKKSIFKFIDLIYDLEKIKNEYNFNSEQSVVTFILKNYIKEKFITPEKLIKIFTNGIIITSNITGLRLVTRCIEISNEYWESEEAEFLAKTNAIIQRLDIDLTFYDAND